MPDAVWSGGETRWLIYVHLPYYGTKPLTISALLSQSSTLSCVCYSCVMGWYSPEPGWKTCCDQLKDQLYPLAAFSLSLCPTVALWEAVSSAGRGFVPHLLPVTWCCPGSLATWTEKVPNLELKVASYLDPSAD